MINRLQQPVLFTCLGYEINSLVDSGEFMSLDEVHQMAEDRTLITWLESKVGALSSWSEEEKLIMSAEFDSLANVSDDSKHYLIHNNGLCLLVAFCFEFINNPPTRTLEDL